LYEIDLPDVIAVRYMILGKQNNERLIELILDATNETGIKYVNKTGNRKDGNRYNNNSIVPAKLDLGKCYPRFSDFRIIYFVSVFLPIAVSVL
jgi:hypothetical protein